MRGPTKRLAASLFGLLSIVAPPAGAADGFAESTIVVPATPPPTIVVPATPPPTIGDLAPGESPGALELESGPVLEYPRVVEPTTSMGTDDESDPAPAGPTLLDNSLLDDGDPISSPALYLFMLMAIPSLTMGLALWFQRGDAATRRRLAKADERAGHR